MDPLEDHLNSLRARLDNLRMSRESIDFAISNTLLEIQQVRRQMTFPERYSCGPARTLAPVDYLDI